MDSLNRTSKGQVTETAATRGTARRRLAVFFIHGTGMCIDSCTRGEFHRLRRIVRGADVRAPGHLIGMVTGANKGSAGNSHESEAAGEPPQLDEFLRRQKPLDWKVASRGLQILPKRQDVAPDRAQVGHSFHDFLRGLAEAEHQSTLGSSRRARGLHVVEHLEADLILALAADVLLESGDGLDVVIEHIGLGRQDSIDAIGTAAEVGSENLNSCTGLLPYRQDATAEMLGSFIGEIVARDRGDHYVLEPKSAASFGQALRLISRHGLGLSPLDGTESARTSACFA
jgi:hypothetical protein